MVDAFRKMAKIVVVIARTLASKGRYVFLISIILFLLSTIFKVSVPFYFAYVISQLQLHGEIHIALILGYAVLFLLIRGLEEFRFGFYVYFEQLFQKNLSLHLLQHFYKIPLRHLESEATSEYAIHSERGLSGIRQFLYNATFFLFPLSLEIIVLLTVLCIKISVLLSLIVALFVGVLIFMTYHFGSYINELQKKWYKTAGQNFAIFTESLSAYQTIRGYGAEGWIINRYKDAVLHFIIQVLTSVRPAILLGILQAIIIATIMALVTFSVLQKPLSIEEKIPLLVLANGLTIQIISPLIQFAGAYRELLHGISASAPLIDLLDVPQTNAKISHRFDKKSQSIILEQVNIRYDDALLIAVPYIELSAHGLTAIIGKTGVGKTTFGKVLGQLKDYEGRIHFPVTCQPILYLKQFPDIFDLPFSDNIRLGKSEDKLSESLLFKSGFTKAELTSLQGRKMGEAGSALSGGQRSRLEIARALFHGAQCYILDEPTSALDKVTSAAIFEHFFALVNHVKLFVITHDIDILSRCSEVILIDNGTVQLISNPSKAKLADLIAKS